MHSDFQQRLLQTETTDRWLWIVIVATFGCFFAAFGIGANNFANAFATSVGSEALTLRQALTLSAVFELLGALLLGRHLVSSLTASLFNLECIATSPALLMYGLMCTLYTTGAWLMLASRFGLPVSAAHSLIGAIIGMLVAYGEDNCIIWHQPIDTFPYMEGISVIAVSWAVSPVLSGAVAMGVFYAVRAFVLRSAHAFDRTFWVLPILAMLTIGINVFFFVYEGPTTVLDASSLSTALVWSVGLGFGASLLLIPTALPTMKLNVLRLFNADGTKRVHPEEPAGLAGLLEAPDEEIEPRATTTRRCGGFVCTDRDVQACVETSPRVGEIHARAEKFDPRVEEVFKYVQVVSAICDSVAHGATSLALATAPLELIYLIYLNGGLLEARGAELGDSKYLIFALGGLGSVLGLLVYGHRIATTLGVKLAKITPSRGFCIEFGASCLVIVGSKLSPPLSSTLSSTDCHVGATAGVALLEEGTGGLNYNTLGWITLGWAATFLVSGLACALGFAQGAYAPHTYDAIELSIPASMAP